MVLDFDSVKLIDGFAGIWFSLFPQYLTKAILLGDSHLTLPFLRVAFSVFNIKSFSTILFFYGAKIRKSNGCCIHTQQSTTFNV
jgi:hypothetical protein